VDNMPIEPTELDERRLRMELMRADIENKQADTRYKRRLADWEPWKAMAVAAGAGATLTLAIIAVLSWFK
jgi:hypothetical protein